MCFFFRKSLSFSTMNLTIFSQKFTFFNGLALKKPSVIWLSGQCQLLSLFRLIDISLMHCSNCGWVLIGNQTSNIEEIKNPNTTPSSKWNRCMHTWFCNDSTSHISSHSEIFCLCMGLWNMDYAIILPVKLHTIDLIQNTLRTLVLDRCSHRMTSSVCSTQNLS